MQNSLLLILQTVISIIRYVCTNKALGLKFKIIEVNIDVKAKLWVRIET